MGDEIHFLQKTGEDQQHAKHNSQKIKESFTTKSHKAITDMNKLVGTQKQQVESFRDLRKDILKESQEQKNQV